MIYDILCWLLCIFIVLQAYAGTAKQFPHLSTRCQGKAEEINHSAYFRLIPECDAYEGYWFMMIDMYTIVYILIHKEKL